MTTVIKIPGWECEPSVLWKAPPPQKVFSVVVEQVALIIPCNGWTDLLGGYTKILVGGWWIYTPLDTDAVIHAMREGR